MLIICHLISGRYFFLYLVRLKKKKCFFFLLDFISNDFSFHSMIVKLRPITQRSLFFFYISFHLHFIKFLKSGQIYFLYVHHSSSRSKQTNLIHLSVLIVKWILESISSPEELNGSANRISCWKAMNFKAFLRQFKFPYILFFIGFKKKLFSYCDWTRK